MKTALSNYEHEKQILIRENYSKLVFGMEDLGSVLSPAIGAMVSEFKPLDLRPWGWRFKK